MSDFEDKLNAILSNPDAMGQIMSLAQSLGKDSKEDGRSTCAPENDGAPSAQNVSPSDSPLAGLANLDPRLLNMAVSLMSAYQSDDDDRAALLAALRPFVKPERYAKLDQAIRISKLTRVIRIALDSFRSKREEEDHV